MTPQTPVIRGFEDQEIVYAKDQPEYQPLPVLPVNENGVLHRWRLTCRERVRLLFVGDLYIHVLNFRQPLQPILPSVTAPDVAPAKKGK